MAMSFAMRILLTQRKTCGGNNPELSRDPKARVEALKLHESVMSGEYIALHRM